MNKDTVCTQYCSCLIANDWINLDFWSVCSGTIWSGEHCKSQKIKQKWNEYASVWDESTSYCLSSTQVAEWMQANWTASGLTTQGHFVCAGGPADGRLVPGDQLVKINNVAVDDLTPEQAAEIIRSKPTAVFTNTRTCSIVWYTRHRLLFRIELCAPCLTSPPSLFVFQGVSRYLDNDGPQNNAGESVESSLPHITETLHYTQSYTDWHFDNWIMAGPFQQKFR